MAGVVNQANYESMMHALEAFAQRTELASNNLINYCASAATVLPSNDAAVEKIISDAKASATSYLQIANGARSIRNMMQRDLDKISEERKVWN